MNYFSEQRISDGAQALIRFDVDSIRKDLATMLDEAAARGASLPLAERTLAIFEQASRDGWGKHDGAALPAYWPGRHKEDLTP